MSPYERVMLKRFLSLDDESREAVYLFLDEVWEEVQADRFGLRDELELQRKKATKERLLAAGHQEAVLNQVLGLEEKSI